MEAETCSCEAPWIGRRDRNAGAPSVLMPESVIPSAGVGRLSPEYYNRCDPFA
jgi:hypothetical protein